MARIVIGENPDGLHGSADAGAFDGERPDPGAPQTAGPQLAMAREEVLSWIAHEIRTPLGIALTAAELLAGELSGAPHPGLRRLDMIRTQIHRVSDLVSSILDAVRLEDGRMVLTLAPIDVRDLVAETIDYWRATAPAMPLVARVPAEPVWALIDASKTRQIIDNLVSNAWKHAAPSTVEIAVERGADQVRLHVRDQGRGIAGEHLDRIFDRFYRAGSGARGHGLGLYIGAALSRLQGGELSVVSAPGVGSTFTLAVPVHRPDGATAAGAGTE
jgi:two-component system, sensor histidine kinase and response regulator